MAPARTRPGSLLRVEELEGRETPSAAPTPLPAIPQHLSWIRIAELDYANGPLDATTTRLLQNDVDLIVSDRSQLGPIAAVTPKTPQLIYTNFSSVYGPLLTSWAAYATQHGDSPESAFYHVTQATPFTGGSPSSQAVNLFWAVYQGGGAWKDLTSQAQSGVGGVPFAPAGGVLAVGYPAPFREMNFDLFSGHGPGWSAVLEYPTAVDAAGNPTAWAPLRALADSTHALARSGQLTFDPPADWKPASLNGSAPLYFVRFRTTATGTPPVAHTIRGRDYVGAAGGLSGVIPAFDSAADTNHDGYLSDAEYANRAPGKDARFLYESRLFAPGYGQMRFATNPADPTFRAWASFYASSYLYTNPQAAGLFVDNSSGAAPAAPGAVSESVASYAALYAALLHDVSQAVGGHLVFANTAGGQTTADAVVPAVSGWFEEFALRPLSCSYLDFEALAAEVRRRQALTSPPRYAVLDSLPAGGSPTDPRTQIATLAEYYLLANPATTFLDFYGGYSPTTSWASHWSAAVTYNVGQPAGDWSLAASGADPTNANLTYRVYQRVYSNALVLYKPLSAGAGSTRGTTAAGTATTVSLAGRYRPLLADGTLGAAVTSVSLRNGEGAILVKA